MRFLPLLLVLSAVGASGCAMWRQSAVVRANNPVFVPAGNREFVWERTVDVIHDYHFQIARENKLDGVVETEYRVGSGILEPWHHDSVGLHERLESSLQSIRRRVFVTVTPAEGGHLIGVEAYKEIEDLRGVAANSSSGATFQNDNPLRRDLNLVVGQSTPSGWIPLGRDTLLEQDMLENLGRAFSR